MLSVFAIGFVAAMLFLVPSAGQAQPAVCGKFEEVGCGQDAHKVLIQVPAIVRGAHTECYVCGSEFPSDCHANCPDEDDVSALSQAAYQSLLAVAAEGDVKAVLALTAEVKGAVFFNGKRNAIQILDCTRSMVVGSLNVESGRLREVARAILPAASDLNLPEWSVAGAGQ